MVSHECDLAQAYRDATGDGAMEIHLQAQCKLIRPWGPIMERAIVSITWWGHEGEEGRGAGGLAGYDGKGEEGTGAREAHGPRVKEAYVWNIGATERREGDKIAWTRAETFVTTTRGYNQKRTMRCFSEDKVLLSVSVEARTTTQKQTDGRALGETQQAHCP
jgi:hypothetical protein